MIYEQRSEPSAVFRSHALLDLRAGTEVAAWFENPAYGIGPRAIDADSHARVVRGFSSDYEKVLPQRIR